MSSECSSQISKTLDAISSDTYNTLDDCSNPPEGMSIEVCQSILAAKNKLQVQASAAAAQSVDVSGINATLKKLSEKIGCDSACQRRKKADELKKKWTDAAKIQKDAPENTEDAERNYYVYTKGESGWKDILVKKYTAIANKNKANSLKEHGKMIDELHLLINDYEAETLALQKLKELLQIRMLESKNINGALDSEDAAAQTNDRKVVYEEWAQDWLGTIKSLLTVIYIVLAIVYLVWGPFLEKSEYKTLKGWIKPLILILLPFTIYYVVSFIYYIQEKIAWWLDNKAPKDVFREED